MKEVFEVEKNYIKNENYKKNLDILLDLVPDYFYEVEASSTGKYHPKFALGEHGLVRHTKVAVAIANEVLNLECMDEYFSHKEKDLILIALILHDSFKLGNPKERYTRFDHPLLVGKFLEENKDKLTFTDMEIKFLINAIASHMGQWNTNSYSDLVLPKPKTKYQIFVHMCDYLASRKFINVEFDENNNIIK